MLISFVPEFVRAGSWAILHFFAKRESTTVFFVVVFLNENPRLSNGMATIQYSITRSFLGKTTLNVRGVGNDIPFPLTESQGFNVRLGDCSHLFACV